MKKLVYSIDQNPLQVKGRQGVSAVCHYNTWIRECVSRLYRWAGTHPTQVHAVLGCELVCSNWGKLNLSCGKGTEMLLTHLAVGFMFLQRREQKEDQLRCSVPWGRQQLTLGGECGGKEEEVVKVPWL